MFSIYIEMDFIIDLLIAIFVIVVVYWIKENINRKYLPGPYGIPLLGYIPFMTTKPYLDFQKLSKTFGPVFRLRLGTVNVIVLSDYHTTKAAFAQDAFMGRPPQLPFELTKENIETGAYNGLAWKEQRRFSLHILKDLGFGRSRIEELIKEEIHDLLHHFQQFDGKPFFLRPLLAPSVSNNISSLVFGQRLKYNDPARKMLDEILTEGADAAGQVAWELFFPLLARILKMFGLSGAAKLNKSERLFRKYAAAQIDMHEKTLDENNIRDYIDGYLLEIRRRNDKAFCKPVLEDMVGMFFGAGSETVRLTVEWLTITMAAYKKVQGKVYAEIQKVIGEDGSPCWKNHVDMPYTEATIMEVMRWQTIIPLNILRYTLWDTELNGHFIPKHHFVLANLWDVHHRPEYWGEDADKFRPERFLTEDGKGLKKVDYFIPFSIGKRQCPAESFAKTEVFLYFVSILQRFEISLPAGKVPNFDADLGVGLKPKLQELCLTKR